MTDPQMSALGKAIREAREQRRLTQWDLGRLVGVQQPAVSAWERGKKLPHADILLNLARVLDLDLRQYAHPGVPWMLIGVGRDIARLVERIMRAGGPASVTLRDPISISPGNFRFPD